MIRKKLSRKERLLWGGSLLVLTVVFFFFFQEAHEWHGPPLLQEQVLLYSAPGPSRSDRHL